MRWFIVFLIVVALAAALVWVGQENAGRGVDLYLPMGYALTDMDMVEFSATCLGSGLVVGLILAAIISIGAQGRSRRRQREIDSLRAQLAEARQVVETLSRRVEAAVEEPEIQPGPREWPEEFEND